MKIVLATNNRHKAEEFKSMLAQLYGKTELYTLSDIGFAGDIEEDGGTFEENALIKARAAASADYLSIADDSGICVDALGGAPGIYSARYAGEHGNDKKNNEKLLYELRNVPAERRGAHYVCAIACVLPDGESFTVTGKAYGRVLTEEHGDGGFGYDPLFLPDGQSLTWGELDEAEKNKTSHRRKAIELFAAELKKRIG